MQHGDRLHPIIDRPHEYRIRSLRLDTGGDGREAYLELELNRGSTTRRLRFLSPQDLKIESGFPRPTGGMEIIDVRSRQLDGLGVRVSDFEASEGAITFWARDVIDADRCEGG